MQEAQSGLVVRTDAGWAGCRRARKSTSGGSISIGGHCIKCWSKTQAVIAKSSAESELYGVVKGACEALGVKTLCNDLGFEVEISLELDATAAKGILDRQGISKVRHIDVNCLWLQEQCAKKMVPLSKIPGEVNTADLMTKHLGNAVIIKHVEKLNLEYSSGRSEKAAQLHAVSQTVPAPRVKVQIPIADHWSERGEYGRWVRVHSTPRVDKFNPSSVPRGPGRKTRLQGIRITQGVRSNGEEFPEEDFWNDSHIDSTQVQPWTGTTTFRVDKAYSKSYGTDQRRQRVAFDNSIRQARFSNHERLTWADCEVSD